MLENQCYAGNEFARMASTPANVTVLRFSTDDLPERERLPTFQEVFGRAIAMRTSSRWPATTFAYKRRYERCRDSAPGSVHFLQSKDAEPASSSPTVMTTLRCGCARRVEALSPSAVEK